MNFKSLCAMFKWRVGKSKVRPAMWVKDKSSGSWSLLPWQQYDELAAELAAGFLKNKVEPRDVVVNIARSNVSWLAADMALMRIGAISAVAAPDAPPEAAAAIIKETEAKAVLTDDPLIVEVARSFKSVKNVIFTARSSEIPEGATAVEHFRMSGDGFDRAAIDQMADAVDLDDVLTIVYTAGPAGDIKGAKITHYNMIQELIALQQIVGATEEDVTLLILPTAHIFGRLIHLLSVYTGLQLALCTNQKELLDDIRYVRPHFLGATPSTYQHIAHLIETDLDRGSGASRLVNKLALGLGNRLQKTSFSGQTLSYLQVVERKLADKLVFERIHNRYFGGRLKFGVSSGAPLGRELGEWYHKMGILLLEAYGLTEACGAVTMNRKNDFRFGTVGKPLSQVELRMAPDGEILVRSPMVMKEYFKDEKATRMVLDKHGFLHTGDIGEIDESGFLRITDKKRDIIVNDAGKVVVPLPIEEKFKDDPFVCRVVVHGEGKPHVVALVTLKKHAVETWAREKGLQFQSYSELCGLPEVVKLVEAAVQARNKDLAPHEIIKKFAILPEEFSVRGGEITVTDRLRRKLISQKYHDVITSLYNPEAEPPADEISERKGKRKKK